MELTAEDLEKGENIDLGASSWLMIDQERINQFAETTEDRQWIHLDVERAKAGPFGTTIAHGYLIMSVIPKLLFEIVQFPDAESIINYGIEKLRFLHPVPADSEVRLKSKVLSSQKKGKGYLMRFRGEVEIKESGRRALITEILLLVQPKANA